MEMWDPHHGAWRRVNDNEPFFPLSSITDFPLPLFLFDELFHHAPAKQGLFRNAKAEHLESLCFMGSVLV